MFSLKKFIDYSQFDKLIPVCLYPIQSNCSIWKEIYNIEINKRKLSLIRVNEKSLNKRIDFRRISAVCQKLWYNFLIIHQNFW